MRSAKIMKTVFFSSDYFEQESQSLSLYAGIISFLVNVLVFVIPDNMESLRYLPQNFLVTMAGFFLVLALVYVMISILRKEITGFIRFFTTVNFFLMISLLVISVPAFLVTYGIAALLLKSGEFAMLLFTLIPYYNFVLFGWLCEKTSGKEGLKGVSVALIAITLLVLFWNLLIYYTI